MGFFALAWPTVERPYWYFYLKGDGHSCLLSNDFFEWYNKRTFGGTVKHQILWALVASLKNRENLRWEKQTR
jgi:hypothetical protein